MSDTSTVPLRLQFILRVGRNGINSNIVNLKSWNHGELIFTAAENVFMSYKEPPSTFYTFVQGLGPADV